MRVIMESLFDVAYLVSAVVFGVLILKKRGNSKAFLIYGLMCLTLVAGDAFHLVPRIIGLNSAAGLDGYTAALGIGTAVTSVTMTIYYVMMYYFMRLHLGTKQDRRVEIAVWVLAAVRIALCLFPQNAWTQKDSPVEWGIYRNIPFVILGALIVVLLWQARGRDRCFSLAWLAVTLSFGFYIPVVLWADVSPMIGMLMLPKTCCYVWLMVMGWRSVKRLA